MRTPAWTTLTALSVLTLAACSPKDEKKADNALNDAAAVVSNAANAAGNAVENISLEATPTPTGQEFADTAAKSDAFEIAAAKLAATNAESPQVKAFAKMMVAAHTESTAKVKAAAAEASPAITPDPALTEDQKSDLAKLKELKGAAFDKEYVDGQVDAHEDALKLMRKYAADGTVPSLKKAAAEIEPVVDKHVTAIKALDKD